MHLKELFGVLLVLVGLSGCASKNEPTSAEPIHLKPEYAELITNKSHPIHSYPKGAYATITYGKAPAPIGGYQNIQKNLVYPRLARRLEVEGVVQVKCYILATGEIDSCVIIQGIPGYKECDKAAIAAIKSVHWTPAEQAGNPVSVWISIPVVFRLDSHRGRY